MGAFARTGRGRPPRFVARDRRARFLEHRARGATLQEAMRETGISAPAVIRLLDEVGYEAALEAVRATLEGEPA